MYLESSTNRKNIDFYDAAWYSIIVATHFICYTKGKPF